METGFPLTEVETSQISQLLLLAETGLLPQNPKLLILVLPSS